MNAYRENSAPLAPDIVRCRWCRREHGTANTDYAEMVDGHIRVYCYADIRARQEWIEQASLDLQEKLRQLGVDSRQRLERMRVGLAMYVNSSNHTEKKP